MKKLLVGTAAIALGLSMVSADANAQGLTLDLAGHMKGYVTWLDQDEEVNLDADADEEDARAFDILRETEVHFTGETTLDNGLTVGMHIEAEADGSDVFGAGNDGFDVEESYAYFSGAWGRVNFGAEDGAAYLLQVAAPSADSNVDGIRQWVNAVNYDLAGDDNTTGARGDIENLFDVGGVFGPRMDYDNALTGRDNKITYLTPVFEGFQGGFSYTPELSDGAEGANSVGGNNTNNVINDYGNVWELSVRWEGQMDEVGIALGAGYASADLEDEPAAGTTLSDRDIWDAGIDLDWGPFGLGVAYLHDDNGIGGTNVLSGEADTETWTVGLDYTTGPFKLGATYYTSDTELDGLADAVPGNFNNGAATEGDVETDRYTAGVVYTYGPGMTFRGSVSHIEHELPVSADGTDFDATSVLLGTQINF